MRRLKAALFFLLAQAVFCGPALGAEKSLFVGVLQEPQVLSDRKAIEELVRYAKTNGYKTLFIQVYRANKSWFASKHADDSFYQANLKKVGQDPLAHLIRRAHASGLKVHAWMNLLSLSANKDAPLLKKYGVSILTKNMEDKRALEDYKIDNQYFMEPGDPRVVEALSEITAELVTAYPDLDGIQLDYIRYPDVKPSYGHTPTNLTLYKRVTGKAPQGESDPDWRKWKRRQVTELVRRLKSRARSIRADIQVSTTGLMPYVRAREESFQDWKEWVDTGLADFVTLMAYTDDAVQFDKYLADAKRRLPDLSKVNIAVATYKLVKQPQAYDKQWEACMAAGLRSCAALDYDSLLKMGRKE